MQVLFRLFRRLFLERLRHAFDMSELRLFFSLAYLPERGQFANYIAGPRHAEWVVYAKEPFGDPHARNSVCCADGTLESCWLSMAVCSSPPTLSQP